MTVDNLEVVVGSQNLMRNKNEQRLAAKRIVKHKDFNATTQTNDIALIELATEVTVYAGVMPACLPTSQPASGTMCTAIGWGKTYGTGQDRVGARIGWGRTDGTEQGDTGQDLRYGVGLAVRGRTGWGRTYRMTCVAPPSPLMMS